SKGVKGVVRIHANASALAQYLPDDLATFAASHPAIKISLEEERSGAIVEAVQTGAADVGIVMEGAEATALQLFAYRADVLCAVLPRKHPVKARELAFAKLLDHDVVAKLVQAGLGIGILPEAAARAFSGPLRLRLVRLTDSWATRRMFVAVRQ